MVLNYKGLMGINIGLYKISYVLKQNYTKQSLNRITSMAIDLKCWIKSYFIRQSSKHFMTE